MLSMKAKTKLNYNLNQYDKPDSKLNDKNDITMLDRLTILDRKGGEQVIYYINQYLRENPESLLISRCELEHIMGVFS
jgi:hypothetical protein